MMDEIRIVVLNGESITTERQLHDALGLEFDFGPYYGNNLDALWDMMTGLGGRVRLFWESSEFSRCEIGPRFDKFVKLFKDLEKWYVEAEIPGCSFEFELR